MDETAIKRVLEGVLRDLGLPEGSADVETAMGSPEAEAIQVRFADEDSGGKAVAVSLNDAARLTRKG